MPEEMMTGPSKPRSENYRPEITRLQELTPGRMAWRRRWRWASEAAIRLLTKSQASGLENFPLSGPAVIVTNHLGDTDVIFGLACMPRFVDPLAKAELYDFPVLGRLMDAYGVIWVHRGVPDRRALRAALAGLNEGRLIGIAPEGRQSLTGQLEAGMGGAAYLALKADVPIVPVTFTGTENANIYSHLRKFRRPKVSMRVGSPFRLEEYPNRKQAVEAGTRKIMKTLAGQLPAGYRGVYSDGDRRAGTG